MIFVFGSLIIFHTIGAQLDGRLMLFWQSALLKFTYSVITYVFVLNKMMMMMIIDYRFDVRSLTAA
jgi:hypothetical protein